MAQVGNQPSVPEKTWPERGGVLTRALICWATRGELPVGVGSQVCMLMPAITGGDCAPTATPPGLDGLPTPAFQTPVAGYGGGGRP
jgi:hypothetical protein